MASDRVSYVKQGPLFVIKLNDPRYLNSLTFVDFIYVTELMEQADKDPDVVFTVIQSTGKFFSAGGKIETVLQTGDVKRDSPADVLYQRFGAISAQNVLVADRFLKHSKILVCCLNGPAVGLSACIAMLCDFVVAANDSVYILFPFSNLGFVAELSASVTLLEKLGYNLASEHLVFSKPVSFQTLMDKKIIVKNYEMKDTETFNQNVLNDLQSSLKHLHHPSLIGIKKLVMSTSYGDDLLKSQPRETAVTLPFWIKGEPLRRFQQLQQKSRRHKL